MRKIDNEKQKLKKFLELLCEIDDRNTNLAYYRTNNYFEKYLEKEITKVSALIESMEDMINDEDLVEKVEEED